jgi:hypothetical protein
MCAYVSYCFFLNPNLLIPAQTLICSSQLGYPKEEGRLTDTNRGIHTCPNACSTCALEAFLLDNETGTDEETGAHSQGQALLVVGWHRCSWLPLPDPNSPPSPPTHLPSFFSPLLNLSKFLLLFSTLLAPLPSQSFPFHTPPTLSFPSCFPWEFNMTSGLQRSPLRHSHNYRFKTKLPWVVLPLLLLTTLCSLTHDWSAMIHGSFCSTLNPQTKQNPRSGSCEWSI